MKFHFVAVVFFLAAIPVVHADPAVMPWKDGETLTYSIKWGVFTAAQSVFVATEQPDHWEFRLHLTSQGFVDTFYQINSWFWSFQQKEPWRSIEYGEDRSEGKHRSRERTQVDYAAGMGVREKWMKGETDHIKITTQALDDIASMLYSLRRHDWKLGDKQPIAVYESSEVKTGEATCVAIEKQAIGAWPEQEVVQLSCEPTGETKKKQKGKLTLWLTHDARHVPLRADLTFKYGTFEITLTDASPAL